MQNIDLETAKLVGIFDLIKQFYRILFISVLLTETIQFSWSNYFFFQCADLICLCDKHAKQRGLES